MNNAGKYLQTLLWLTALHSFSVAGMLILLGNSGIVHFGFPEGNQFFQAQGGVFHMVMCVAYLLAAYDIKNYKLIYFIIIAKAIATIYLILYYFLADNILTILLSGVVDGILALLIYLLWNASEKEAPR